MENTQKFGWRQWLMMLGFGLSLAVVIFFTIRSFRQAPRFRMDEPIRPWMSLPYIARSYRVPPYVLYDALGIPLQRHDRRPLSFIAAMQNRSVAYIIVELQNAIVHARPPYPTPPLTPAPTQSAS